MADAPVRYWIDRGDRIVAVNDAWDAFAEANRTPHLVKDKIVGQSIWDSISDLTTRELYAALLTQVRAGRRVEFGFRCDSPALRRDMRMALTAEGDRVAFESRVVSVSPRATQPIWDAAQLRGSDLLTVCGWCKRVRVGPQWLEAEVAIPVLGLFQSRAMPQLTHGMCADCVAAFMETLGT